MSRLIRKSYSAASGNTTGGVSDMTTCYVYNSTMGFADSNPLGQLKIVWQQPQSAGSCSSWPPSSAVGVRLFSNHDAMGRVGRDTQCLAMTSQYCSTTTGQFLYSYNLLGNPVQFNNGIAPPSTVTATQTVSSNGNGTPITAPSLTWKTTYDIADHILQVGVQDQPSYATGTTPAPVFPSTTYSIAPTFLNATNYDAFGHMTSAQLGIPNGSSTAAINIARQYDNRGRENLELDTGYNTSNTATNSVGAVAISGVEQGPAYPISSYPKTTVTVSGSERQTTTDPCQACHQYGCPPCPQTVYDQGTVTLTVNGITVSSYYDYGWTPSWIASTLASTINGKVSGVVVTSSGSTITIRSTQTGTAKNGTGSVSATSSTNSTLSAFVGTSFPVSVSSITLNGGYNTTPSVYDAGTVSVTINGATASVPFNQSSTPQSIATALNTAIQNAAGSYVTTKLDGDSSLLVSNYTGSSTDWQITAAVTYDTTDFTAPSFLVTTGAMAEGYSAASGQSPAYFYYVPEGGYAPNGNILMHSDSVMGDWLFSYDAMDRLSTAMQFASTPASTQFAGVNGSWSYDSYGNRTAQSFSNSVYSNWATYNPANNRIATATSALGGYVYDASGNTLYDGNNEYWYDAEGQLCAVQSQAVTGLPVIQYVYDAEGARIAKGTLSAPPAQYTLISGNLASSPTCAPPFSSGFTLTTRYLVDPGGNQVTELSEQSGQVWKHSNVFSAARLTATYDTSGLHYALADPLGTKRVQANISGIVEEWYVSLPYGDALTPIPNPACTAANYCYAEDATEHHFTGKERDSESGNDYFEARYYSSAMGRFMSPDWSAKEDPVPYAKLDNPQTLNLYAYVQNNPLFKPDLDGHGCPPDCSSQSPAPGGSANPANNSFLQWVQAETAGTVEMGKQAFSMLSALPVVGVLFGADSAAVSAIQGNTGEATTTAALAAIPAGGEIGAGGRALELAGTMGKTADFVTIAVTKTAEGVDVVSSSEKAVRPAVQAALRPGEVAVQGAGHAEVTGVNGARQMGLTPTGVGASRGICPSCADFLRSAGVSALSALKQIF